MRAWPHLRQVPVPPIRPPVRPARTLPLVFEDPVYREAVVDLLGAIAYGEISAFERLAEDAKLAPTLEDKVAIGADGERRVRPRRRAARPARPSSAPTRSRRWRRSAPRIDHFHAHTAPADWFEGLIKAYVGDGLAADFYREIAAYLDTDTRDLIVASLEDAGQRRSSSTGSAAAIAADPRLGGRLALWGRRLMGEALTQAQRVAAERDALSALLAGGVDRPGPRPGRASAGCSPGSPSGTPTRMAELGLLDA